MSDTADLGRTKSLPEIVLASTSPESVGLRSEAMIFLSGRRILLVALGQFWFAPWRRRSGCRSEGSLKQPSGDREQIYLF